MLNLIITNKTTPEIYQILDKEYNDSLEMKYNIFPKTSMLLVVGVIKLNDIDIILENLRNVCIPDIEIDFIRESIKTKDIFFFDTSKNTDTIIYSVKFNYILKSNENCIMVKCVAVRTVLDESMFNCIYNYFGIRNKEYENIVMKDTFGQMNGLLNKIS